MSIHACSQKDDGLNAFPVIGHYQKGPNVNLYQTSNKITLKYIVFCVGQTDGLFIDYFMVHWIKCFQQSYIKGYLQR